MREPWDDEYVRSRERSAAAHRPSAALKRKISKSIARVSVNCNYDELLDDIKTATSVNEIELFNTAINEKKKRFRARLESDLNDFWSKRERRAMDTELGDHQDEQATRAIHYIDHDFFINIQPNINYLNLGATTALITDDLLQALKSQKQLKGIAYWPRYEYKTPMASALLNQEQDDYDVRMLRTMSALSLHCLQIR